MKINNLIPVYGNSNLKRDPKTQALLNCNYDKLNVSKTLNSPTNFSRAAGVSFKWTAGPKAGAFQLFLQNLKHRRTSAP